MALTPGDLERGPFGFAPGRGTRAYSLGGVMSGASAGGGKWRASAQYDMENRIARATALGDAWGDGRLLLHAAASDSRAERSTEWGLSATLRAPEYVASARAKDGPEFYGSLCSRLAPGSVVTLGGEAMLSVPELRRRAPGAARAGAGAGAAGGAGSAISYAVSAAADVGAHKTSAHLHVSKTYPRGVASAHHVVRLTERATLAAKAMVNVASRESMVAAGYRLRLRNTATTVHGMIDTYGNCRQAVERELMRDVRVSVSLETRLAPGADAGGAQEVATVGIKATLGGVPAYKAPLSPVLMSASIFGAL